MPENNEKEPQYKSILSDDDGTAPRPIRKKQRDPMAEVRREIEEQQRQQREKAELLKLRQGLIDESDEIPEDEPPKFEKPTGAKAVENFFYHYKWRLIGIIVTVALLTFMTIQTVTREKKDLYVLAISTTGSSGIYAKTHDIEVALERYCPDFDGNGKVHVGVNFIDLSTEGGYSEYTDAQNEKFSAELFSGDSQLYLTDEGIITLINRIAASGEKKPPPKKQTVRLSSSSPISAGNTRTPCCTTAAVCSSTPPDSLTKHAGRAARIPWVCTSVIRSKT